MIAENSENYYNIKNYNNIKHCKLEKCIKLTIGTGPTGTDKRDRDDQRPDIIGQRMRPPKKTDERLSEVEIAPHRCPRTDLDVVD